MRMLPKRSNTILLEKIQKVGCKYQANGRGGDLVA
jgi:hypothetical protein